MNIIYRIIITAAFALPIYTGSAQTIQGIVQVNGTNYSASISTGGGVSLTGSGASYNIGLAVPPQLGAALTGTAIGTGTFAAGAGQLIIASATGGNVAVILPAAPADKSRIGIKLVGMSGTNLCTVACSGSDHFNTAAGVTSGTFALLNQAAQYQYVASGTAWVVISDDLPLSQLDARYLAITGTLPGAQVSGTVQLAASALALTNTAGVSLVTTGGTAVVIGGYLTSLNGIADLNQIYELGSGGIVNAQGGIVNQGGGGIQCTGGGYSVSGTGGFAILGSGVFSGAATGLSGNAASLRAGVSTTTDGLSSTGTINVLRSVNGTTVASATTAAMASGLNSSGSSAVLAAVNGITVASASNATTSSTAAQLGLVVAASRIPGFVTGGTCAGLINSYFSGGYIHDAHLLLDAPFQYEAALLTGDNAWITFQPGITITGATNSFCPAFSNAHRTYVNLSGSAGTVAPLVSATAPLYGDRNIRIDGPGLIDANRDAQTASATTGGHYPIPGSIYTVGPGLVGARCVFATDFSGVDGLDLEDFRVTRQCTFANVIGNCRNVVRRNLTVFKPALSATNNQYYATDDYFHDDGSVIRERSYNLRCFDNSDNPFCWNPGDYWTCIQGGQSSLGYSGSYWLCQWANCGPDVDCVAEKCYANGQGVGWFCGNPAEDAATGLQNGISNSRFDFYLDTPSPYRGQQVSSVTFGLNGSNNIISFFIAPGRGPASYAGNSQSIAISGSISNTIIRDCQCLDYNSPGSFIGLGGAVTGSYINGALVQNCTVTGTSSTSGSSGQAFLYVAGSPGSGVVTNVQVCDNAMTRMGDVVSDSDVTRGLFSNLGGAGNLIVNPALGARMVNAAGGVAGLSGQFAAPLSAQYADEYIGRVQLTTTGNIMQSVGSAANRDPVATFIRWLQDNGLYQDCCGYIFNSQHNNQTQVPVGFGGLYSPCSSIGDGPITTTTNGYQGAWYFTAPNFPASLSGSHAKAVVAVARGTGTDPNAAYAWYNWIISGIGNSTIFANELNIYLVNDGNLFAVATGTSGINPEATQVELALPGVSATNVNVMCGAIYSGTSLNMVAQSGTSSASSWTSAAPPLVPVGQTLKFGEFGTGPLYYGGQAIIPFIAWFDINLTAAQLKALHDILAQTVCAGTGL